MNLLISLLGLSVAAGVIWFYGPLLSTQTFAPFATTEKRVYAILFCVLAWTLKFLLIDMDFTNIWQQNNPHIRHHVKLMINRFHGAMRFMKRTTINSHGRTVSLKDLPWFLLIGPAQSGKTTLLAHSRINYILARQFTPTAPEHFEPSENCDWWVTRDNGIIDVPSKYIFDNNTKKNNIAGLQHILWKFFLALLKKQGGKKNINGIVIAIPLPEIMKLNDQKQFHGTIQTLAKSINDIQSSLQKQLPCYLVITKCDLLAGFKAFFAESTDDEIAQSWGIMLPGSKKSDRIEQIFTSHFNALIKKLNEQLLWRLHQERDPLTRPAIKDFPLQIEKLKGVAMDFIKQLHHGSGRCYLRGVYLTSAIQTRPDITHAIHDEDVNHTERAIQLLKGPTTQSRSYFIKQFITNSLIIPPQNLIPIQNQSKRGRYAVYAASTAAFTVAAITLGLDFKTGIAQTHEIKSSLAEYHHVLRQFHNPNESMLKTLALLERLQNSIKAEHHANILQTLLSYYSNKSQKSTSLVYNHALQAFLMPEIKNYLADYLNNPVNKDNDSLYSTLKAYLMLGDSSHFDPAYVRNVLEQIVPNTFSKTNQLLHHFDEAAKQVRPIQLDNKLITDTRQYLFSLRGIQLGNVILRSLDSNIVPSDSLLGSDVQTNALFSSTNGEASVERMFIGKNFINVFEQQIQIAAQEAAGGNWILGENPHHSQNPTYTAELADEIRSDYVKRYAFVWENMIDTIKIESPRDLEQADAIISNLTSYDSPLLKILNTIYENTYFEPIVTASPKLQSLGRLIDKSSPEKNQLYLILSNLEELHHYIQPVLSANDSRKAAYQLIAKRLQHPDETDPITKLRMSAERSPMPLKGWINQLTNDIWHYLLKNSMRYLDTSWMEHVSKPYQSYIADRYPFNRDADEEVSLKKFAHFFGKPGVVVSYFNQYLTPFVDTSKPEWKWKKIHNQELPLSPEVLRQIQQAMKIHHAFFPNNDDNVSVPFALQQQKLGKNITSIRFTMNSKVVLDKRNNDTPIAMEWPYDIDGKYSSIELNLAGKNPVEMDFPGAWGWFKLINNAYESSKSSKEIILNFSKDKQPAQYLLTTQSKNNLFIAMNLHHFSLPDQLTTLKT